MTTRLTKTMTVGVVELRTVCEERARYIADLSKFIPYMDDVEDLAKLADLQESFIVAMGELSIRN